MKPNRSLLALYLYTLLFFVLPAHVLVQNAFTPLVLTVPTYGLAALPASFIFQINIEALLVLIGLYIAIYLLVWLMLKLLQVYHFDAALQHLAQGTDGRGLAGMRRFTTIVAVLLLLALLPRANAEGLVVLAVVAMS